MAILALLNTKAGFAAVGLLLCLLVLGYYKAKVAGLTALHSIEVSQLKAEAEKQKADAEINGKRNEVCQSDMVLAKGQIAAQNAAVARLKVDGERKTKAAVAAALAKLKSPAEIQEQVEQGQTGPAGMNLFLAQTFGAGVL